MYAFDVRNITEECVNWIKKFFDENGKDCNAVLGISGGKDSSVVAALLCRALGADRVIGVLMPNGNQTDIDDSHKLCSHLGIKSITINIKSAVDGLINELSPAMEVSTQTKVNLPARIRMATVYAVSQSNNGRVANTCNLSEDWVGYSTRYGDAAGDFAPLAGLTVTEVVQIGRYLGLPDDLARKVPSDGLTDRTDEDNLGFSYAQLDRYIREGIEPPLEIKERIDRLHKQNLFKLQMMPMFASVNLNTMIK